MPNQKLDPSRLFDWYFSDISPVDGARYHAIEERPQQTLLLRSLYEANNLIHFALWSELPKAHPVRELWLEAETDLEATIYLAYGGFFRQALTVLRSWFEIAIYGVYFSFHYGQPSGRYEQWRRGERHAPANMQKISRSIAAQFGTQPIEEDVKDALAVLVQIYAFLSEHVHGQGLDVHDLREGRDNVPRFLSKSVDIWFETTFRVFSAVYRLYAILFGNYVRAYLGSSASGRKRLVKLYGQLEARLPCLESFLREGS